MTEVEPLLNRTSSSNSGDSSFREVPEALVLKSLQEVSLSHKLHSEPSTASSPPALQNEKPVPAAKVLTASTVRPLGSAVIIATPLESKVSKGVFFRAKTLEAYGMKVLTETLQFYIKEGGIFEFVPQGINICCIDQGVNKQHRVFIRGQLKKENFNKFTCEAQRTTTVNLTSLHKMIKTIKKKDSLEMIIDSSETKHLNFRIQTGSTAANYSNSSVNITDTQRIQMNDMDYDLGEPIVIPSKEFQKMCRGLNGIAREMEITCTNKGVVRCFCAGSGVGHKDHVFNDEVEDDNKQPVYIVYRQHFPTRYITICSKLAGLGTNVIMYPTSENHPLTLKMHVASLGEIYLSIKSNEQMEIERGVVPRA